MVLCVERLAHLESTTAPVKSGQKEMLGKLGLLEKRPDDVEGKRKGRNTET